MQTQETTPLPITHNKPDGYMQRKITKDLLRYQCGRQMWCPVCEGLLDIRRVASVDLMRGSDIVATRAYCDSCWREHGESHIRSVLATPAGQGITVILTMGRGL